jgi:protein-disulfide isomerase
MANQLGVNATPTILVGKRGGELKAVDADATDVSAYKSAIDAVLGQA